MAGTTSGTSPPRQVDYEAMALVVAAYRVLDAYIHTTRSLPPASTAVRGSTHPHIRGPHVVDDWVHVAQLFSALMMSGNATTVELDGIPSASTSHPINLLKKMIRSSGNAAIWRIFSNIYSCATYLVSLCDPTRIQVSADSSHVVLTTLNALAKPSVGHDHCW
jgi:hypothetical protein